MKSIIAIALLALSVSAHALTVEEYASEIAANAKMMGEQKRRLSEGTITITEVKARKAAVWYKVVGDLSREAYMRLGAFTIQRLCNYPDYREFYRAGGEFKFTYLGLDNTFVYGEAINNPVCNAIGIP